MNVFESLANEIIDEVCDRFLELYPVPVKPEFLAESEDAHHLYGEAYYNLESHIADRIEQFTAVLGISEEQLNGLREIDSGDNPLF